MSAILNAGATAPDFSLSVNPDKKITLRELRGKPVILAFYPADWSPVCGDQMALYNESSAGVSEVRGGTGRHFRRRGLVPRRVRQGSQSPFSSGRRLRTQGCGRPRLWGLP